MNHKGWCNDFHGLYQHYFLTIQSLARPWQDWGSELSARKERSFVVPLTYYLAVVPVFALLRLSSRRLIVELEPVRWWPRYCIRSSPNITPSGLLASPGHTRWPWRYGRGPLAMEFSSLSTYLRSLSTYAHSLPKFNRDVLWGFRSDWPTCLWFKQKFIRDKIKIQWVIVCSSTTFQSLWAMSSYSWEKRKRKKERFYFF